MVFGLFQKKRSNKSNKRTNRKLRSKTAKRRRSRRVRGGYNAPLGEAYPGGAMEAGAGDEMEKFMGHQEAFENQGADDGQKTPDMADPVAPPAPTEAGAPAAAGDKMEGGRRRKFRKGRKGYVPELTALALTAANFYGPKGKSRKLRRSRRNKSRRKGGRR